MKNALILGYEIQSAPGPIAQPEQLKFYKPDQSPIESTSPFTYMADALVGLSCLVLNPHLKNPFSGYKFNFSFVHEAWLALDPHREVFERNQIRVSSLQKHSPAPPPKSIEHFEKSFSELVAAAMTPNGVNFAELCRLITLIDELETQMDSPLLYNFALKFSRKTTQDLHALFSMLYHLRAVIALDYNAYTQDPTFEAVKVDAITDYLPKAEYIVNDAMLYYNFKNLHAAYPKSEETKFYQQMHKGFEQWLHHGMHLIEQLPASFLKSIPKSKIEDTLYLTQMDWLLSSESGLLFKIREELFGLHDGYHEIFWNDLSEKTPQPESKLNICCHVRESDIAPKAAS